MTNKQIKDKEYYERTRPKDRPRAYPIETHRSWGHDIREYTKGKPVCWTCAVAKRKEYAAKNRERMTFHLAKNRCNNPNNPKFYDYGGRGIKFLFTSFEQFFAEVGKRPEGMTLDRIDVNGNYQPGNVRWATVSEQNANQRRWFTNGQI